jgi:hypothetical protein
MANRPTLINVTFDMNGQSQIISALAKKFKTGSEGYNGNGKIIDPQTGEKYQVSLNIIRIGSKPVAPKGKK